MRPKILITTQDGYDTVCGCPNTVLPLSVSEAVCAGGGLPFVALDVRTAEEYALFMDALVIAEGGPVHPARWGGIFRESAELSGFSRTRDDLDFALAARFIEAGKPVLGLGRGAFVINALLGGDACFRPGEAGDKVGAAVSGFPADALPGKNELKRTLPWALGHLPACLIPEIISGDGGILGFSHRNLPVHGIAGVPLEQCGLSALLGCFCEEVGR